MRKLHGRFNTKILERIAAANHNAQEVRERRRTNAQRGQHQRTDILRHVADRVLKLLERFGGCFRSPAELVAHRLQDDALSTEHVAGRLHRLNLFLLLVREAYTRPRQT